MRTKNRKERLLKIGRFVYTTLLIVLVTLVLLEIFFLIPVMIHNKLVNNPIDNQLKLEVYAGEDWFKQYLKEDAAAIMEYTPYLSYKRVANQHGDYVNIDNESNRKTENPCSPGEITIFFLAVLLHGELGLETNIQSRLYYQNTYAKKDTK